MPVQAMEAVNALVAAVVKDLSDPEGLGRVRVTYPHLGDETSEYARLVSPMAGAERGMFFRPQPGDEVLVGFEFGDPRRPYIIGSVWSSADKPPPGANDKPDENNLRFFRSRSGQIIRFDDTPSNERIEIIDKDGARRVVVDSANNKIEVSCDQGDVDISAPSGTVTISAMNISIKATGSVTIKGATVGINDPG
jgi:uncharacterized protein involved in type VI secretion and phage assembly